MKRLTVLLAACVLAVGCGKDEKGVPPPVDPNAKNGQAPGLPTRGTPAKSGKGDITTGGAGQFKQGE